MPGCGMYDSNLKTDLIWAQVHNFLFCTKCSLRYLEMKFSKKDLSFEMIAGISDQADISNIIGSQFHLW